MNASIKKYKALILCLTLVTLSLLSFKQKQAFDLAASIERGKSIYEASCASCHMENGEGLSGVFPPLAKADYLMADKNRSIKLVLQGLTGEIQVNGTIYNGDMPGIALSNEQVADVLNYVRNTWGNKGEAIKPEEVKKALQ